MYKWTDMYHYSQCLPEIFTPACQGFVRVDNVVLLSFSYLLKFNNKLTIFIVAVIKSQFRFNCKEEEFM